jgi:ribonucleoside-diphosphate reductase alpha chain
VDLGCQRIEDVCSQVEIKAQLHSNGIKTAEIHETLSNADLISPETPDYQYLSARLAIFSSAHMDNMNRPYLFKQSSNNG